MMEGVNRTRPKIRDSRLPITKELLLLIVKILPFICSSSYEVKLFQAAFSLAYHGLLRIGELAVSNGKSAHIISISDVSWSSFGVLNIRVPSSKTDQLGTGALSTFQSQPNSETCPCKLIKSFLMDRPPLPGALFCHYNGPAFTRYQFITVLKKSLERVGVNYKNYSSHSFRIGCATSLSLGGVPDAIIMELGRWKSNAYKTYIRS